MMLWLTIPGLDSNLRPGLSTRERSFSMINHKRTNA
jgi:hypothetical protein